MKHDVAILTAGRDRPYALGLASSLIAEGIEFDFIGSDELEAPELRECPAVRVLNLRGDMRPNVTPLRKVMRVARYYLRLIVYSVRTPASVFHILWNNRLEYFDRTLLLTFYKILGKRLVFTVHNVNIRKRDGKDTLLNRLTLRYQYWLVDHLFVHTQRMADELRAEFAVTPSKISVIPFGINKSVPDTSLNSEAARSQLGVELSEKILLFFGNIARYKGLDLLVEAMPMILGRVADIRLIIAGRPKGEEKYWTAIDRRIGELGLDAKVTKRIEYVSDDETEVFFKAADVLVLPYTFVFQSGVLFLGYSFGIPVIATDVGSLKDEIIQGQTGYVCASNDPHALAESIIEYFSGDVFRNLAGRRAAIRSYAAERYSWATVARITHGVYKRILGVTHLDSDATP